MGKLWKGRYRGQRQKWYLARFLGEDRDVDLDTPHPEFRAWKWAGTADLPHMIVPFKQQLYAEVLDAFGRWLKSRSPETPSHHFSPETEIGRASCRERECQYVKISV